MMDTNQLGRRNLSPVDFKLALGRRYNRTKKTQGGDRKSEESNTQNGNLISTAEKLASQHGVSKNTVIRAGKLAEAVEAHPEIKPDAVVGGARGSRGQGVFLSMPLQHAPSLPCITHAITL